MIIICVELIYLIRNGHTLVRWSRRTFSPYFEHQNYTLKQYTSLTKPTANLNIRMQKIVASIPKNILNKVIFLQLRATQ